MTNILKNILRIIDEKKIKHMALAAKLNWSESKLSKVLNGMVKLKEDMIEKMAKALEVKESLITQTKEEEIINDFEVTPPENIYKDEVHLYKKLLNAKDKVIESLEKRNEQLSEKLKKG